jgi:hypothetical protein
MSFGSDTILFVTLTETGVPDAAGVMTFTRTPVAVPGCHHRPLSAAETPEWLTDIGTQVWKTTAPPQAAAIAAKSTGELVVGGVTYRIIGGAQPFKDFTPNVFKVTILSQLVEA